MANKPKKYLFVCYLGINRSRTASEMYNGKYIGIFWHSVKSDLFKNYLAWCDNIIVMQEYMARKVAKHTDKPIYILDIDDKYLYNDTDLKELIKKRMKVKRLWTKIEHLN